MDKTEYPRVINYHVRRKGQHAHVFIHSATIELDEARSFPVSSVSSNAEKDEDWLLSLFVQEWPAPDTRHLEERVAELERMSARRDDILVAFESSIKRHDKRLSCMDALKLRIESYANILRRAECDILRLEEVLQKDQQRMDQVAPPKHKQEQPGAPAEYTEGICSDGAAILRDGEQMTISEILSDLNKVAEQPKTRELSYICKDELNRNSVLLDGKGIIKANKMINSGRTIGLIGRNSLGIIAHFYLEDV